ncbi:MAG: peptide ABC transporter substrate-binding protein [Spirochaetales bacterium]|jgi:peptide/nickel transport system substrate-binding protein/oligopeptide transport system substrate-binding protein|nr:peptide ABC transporter substrate-binding protein [Spirochaetales bacterium]
MKPFFLALFLAAGFCSGGAQNLVAEKTLVLAVGNEGRGNFNPLQSYSAADAQIFSALYEGLVSYHPVSLEPVPGAAGRWEISPDGRIYRFFIREEARYWNGDPVQAQDFRDTWLILLNPQEEAPYSFLLDIIRGARAYRTGAVSSPDGVGIRVVDPLVLEVELESPADYFLKILCHHSFAPLHPSLRSRYRRDQPLPGLGNGSFYFYRGESGGYLLRRNEAYWDAGRVGLNQIRVVYETDPVESALRFNRGEIHWALGNVSVEDVENRQSLIVNPIFATSYYFFSEKTPPFNDPRLTRALALLLPWEEIRSPERYYLPTERLIPPLQDYPGQPGIAAPNRPEALELLNQAGFPGGEGLPPLVFRLPQGAEEAPEVGLMKAAWEEELGALVRLDMVPWEEYYDSLKTQGWTLAQISWIGDFADPLTFLQMWESGSFLNDSGYANPEFDELLAQASRQEGTERLKTLARSEGLLLQSGAVLPVNHQPAFNVLDLSLISGWYPNPMDIHPFKYLSFSLPQLPPNIAFLPGEPSNRPE